MAIKIERKIGSWYTSLKPRKVIYQRGRNGNSPNGSNPANRIISIYDENCNLATNRPIMTLRRAILEEGYDFWKPDWMSSGRKVLESDNSFNIFSVKQNRKKEVIADGETRNF